ncbi:CRISPR system precrRNA processing endoribonuclease RAMP protein Cas6 [Desulfobacter latus]|uniref:CRISPR system precrRNA processing endoribonuclease RAMP protein Cas6 n=1 Tax=Desulfobacter latus TaxID=2292 RepID=A0A850SWS9_9BACT|nr:CRISPR system precrRNA processing endoribonuclease RAMP protein Cas6 [Desulfobacter latus]NWH03863.1 CRISPR system precrRNA processing endoribonuclease RAMP protein Cas6 [Desulfobacter latus]
MPELSPNLPYDISPLLDLKIARFRLPFRTEIAGEALDIIPHFRSRLGLILKQRFCPHMDFTQIDCEYCDRRMVCCYSLMFTPTCAVIETAGSSRKRCHADPPRPYTLNLSLPTRDRPASLVLTLIGEQAINFSRPMLESLSQASAVPASSIKTTPSHWQALLPLKDALGRGLAVTEGSVAPEENRGDFLKNWIRALPDPGLGKSRSGKDLMELIFTSPVQDKRLERGIGLSPLLKSIVGRLRDLKRIYHPDNAMGTLPESFFKSAREVTVFTHLSLKKATWFSKHRNRPISLGGFTGEMMLKGDLSPYIPILAVGYFLGIGSKTVYGLGRFITDGWNGSE